MPKPNRPTPVGQCTYCGQIRERHDDHVPPECLFPAPKPSNLITVPCCEPCNREFGKDDEFFKTAISLTLDGKQSPHIQAVIDSSVRSLGRKNRDGYRALFLKNAQRVFVKDTAGVLVPTFAIGVDQERILRFGRRLVRGLYFATTHSRLPDSCQVQTVVNDLPFDDQFAAYMLSLPARIIHEDVFAYRYCIDGDDPRFSGWIFAFYKRFFICGITVPQAASTEDP